MTPDDILKQPLFQLNLVIFLSMDSPNNGPYTPVFKNAGYQLLYIEQPIPIARQIHSRLTKHGLTVNHKVVPEVILEHADGSVFMLIECKNSSFGPDTSQAHQAQGYLSLNGELLSKILGAPSTPLWKSEVTYVSLEGHGDRIHDTLCVLSERLKGVGLSYADYKASFEWIKRNDGIYLGKASTSSDLYHLVIASPVKVLALNENEDPRTLQLICYSPEAATDDPYSVRVFEEKMRAAIGSMFARVSTSEVKIEIDTDVMPQIIPVWSLWKHRDSTKHVRDKVKRFIRTVMRQIFELTELQITLHQNEVRIPPATTDQIRMLYAYLQTTKYRKSTLSYIQQGQFSDIENGFDAA